MSKGIVVVTGGTRGIGKAIVEKFIEQGYEVLTCGKNANNLDAIKREFGNKIHIFQADFRRKVDVLAFSEFIKTFDKPLFALIHNAGYFEQGSFFNEREDLLPELLDVNVLSMYYLTKSLQGTIEGNPNCHIFTISSIAGIQGFADSASYCVSKFAVQGFTKSLREMLKPLGIKVTAVLPGATLTDSWAGVDLPIERFIDPRAIADSIFSAFSMGKSSLIEEIIVRPTLGDI
ncbi:MAG: SDR family oxidoreductase [Leadbetterella sp.]